MIPAATELDSLRFAVSSVRNETLFRPTRSPLYGMSSLPGNPCPALYGMSSLEKKRYKVNPSVRNELLKRVTRPARHRMDKSSGVTRPSLYGMSSPGR
ncbi:hypothetical protein RRG08_038165 [Elysia crispata]|uniref:Uncharacterized protein n=1 Tax=Elysia crispata TaxID=231223 RepID=A0AAE1CPD3_9GAST|nr:hypothetical protein RRG08_038165 [Elysia crispata]